MKITLFSSNQSRHINFANKLSKIADETYFVSEIKTLFPGVLKDFYEKDDTFQNYFLKVKASEEKIFSGINFLSDRIKTLPIKLGDLSYLSETYLSECLASDIFIVFGSSYIKGWLADYLINKKAINIHMGLSPYYRGSACNFWALYDYSPEYVGATIHLLSKGLDSGDILFHSVPTYVETDSAFDFSMRAVQSAHNDLIRCINQELIFEIQPKPQNKENEIRYSRYEDFNKDVAKEFLNRKTDYSFKNLHYPDLYLI